MCKPKTPAMYEPPAARAAERFPDRVLANSAGQTRANYAPRGSSSAPGSARKRAPTAVLGASSGETGVVLG